MDLDKLIAEAVKHMQLQKSAVEDSPDASSEGSGPPADADPDTKEDSDKAEAPKGDAPPADAPAGPPADAAPPADAPPGDAPVDPALDSAPATVEDYAAEYAKLPDDLLDMHIAAAQQVKAMRTAPVAPPAAPPMAAPPAPAPAAPAAAPPVAPPMAPPQPDPLAALKSENASLKDELTQALAKSTKNEETFKALLQSLGVDGKPVRKSYQAASEVAGAVAGPDLSKMTRAEAKSILSKKLRDGKLSKSDADLVLKFELGSVGLKEIASLLK